MSIKNYIHINQSPEYSRVRNKILRKLSANENGLTLAETAAMMGIKPNCSQDTVHSHLKYCTKMGKVGLTKVDGRGAVYTFIGYFKEV